MPPEPFLPPVPTAPVTHLRTRIFLLAVVALILLVAGFVLLFFYLRGASPEARFGIGDSGQTVVYVYEKGTLTLASELAVPAPETFTPEGSEPIAIEANEDALTACLSEECTDIFRYGIPAERPVVFDVSGNTLALISPLTSEFLVYTLYPALPARIEPVFVAENTVMPGVSALTKHPTKEQTFVFAESITTDDGPMLRACTVTYLENGTALKSSHCAQIPLTAPLTAPSITVLP